MTVSVTNTSTSLWDLMSKAQKTIALNTRGSNPAHRLVLQNTDSNDIFVNITDTATSSDTEISAGGGSLELKVQDLDNINLIASATTALQVLFNTTL